MTQLHPGVPPPPPAYAEYPPPPPYLQQPAPPMMPAPLPPHIHPPRPRRTGGLTLALAAIAVALAAAALIVALLRPGATPTPPRATPTTAPATPTFTTEQVTAAKTKACRAAKGANDDLLDKTNRPDGPDDTRNWTYAALARNAYISAAVWLPTQVDPAAPKDLRDAVLAFSAATGNAFASVLSHDADQRRSDQDVMSAKWSDVERLCNG